VKKIKKYSDLSVPSAMLSHHPDSLQNVRAVGLLTWAAVTDVLQEIAKTTYQEDEKAYADRAVSWLRDRGLARHASV
jgi:hypothetical protein